MKSIGKLIINAYNCHNKKVALPANDNLVSTIDAIQKFILMLSTEGLIKTLPEHAAFRRQTEINFINMHVSRRLQKLSINFRVRKPNTEHLQFHLRSS